MYQLRDLNDRLCRNKSEVYDGLRMKCVMDYVCAYYMYASVWLWWPQAMSYGSRNMNLEW